ncbi:MAG TPA: exodeoxyribonuclease VII small subunit, partial [Spirochaetes bacterium]|nr:exodeoxyribonuclease VII small subunit [Spirochaetota bacterium]
MNQLEDIVEQLESGDIALEDSLKLYEKGMNLSKTCQDKLSQAERKVYILKTGVTIPESKKLSKKKGQEEIQSQLTDNFDLF